jgi:hypothetical protein
VSRLAGMLALLLALVPAPGWAQGASAPAPAEEEPAAEEPAGEVDANPEPDPLEQSLRTLVQRYYDSIGTEASGADLEQGIRAVKLMLIDGVSLGRIEAAVDTAISLHTPGRRIPFQVAVPLRIRPEGGDEGSSPPPVARSEPRRAPDPAHSPRTEPSAGEDSGPAERAGTVIEERWVKRQEELRARRNRLRLYLQWRDRTREKRILLGVGIPMFAAGWAASWALAGGTLTTGAELPSVGWTGAIPLAGPIIFGVLTEGAYPPVFVFAGFQGIGLALTIAGLAQRHDLPYDRDPTAMRIGRDPRTGRPVLTIAPRPVGMGAGVLGRF